jgi:hypothetical protein
MRAGGRPGTREWDVVDPLGWWPGKYAECKRIVRLVEDFLPHGEVLAAGGPEIFAELLPGHLVHTARIADGIDLCRLPYPDDRFDVGVSARVLELLPPRLRASYLLELVRVCRYRVFVALVLQPELESIDKIKNSYVWDTSRVWQHPGMHPEELEALLDGRGIELVFHVESPAGIGYLPLDQIGRAGGEAMARIPPSGFVVAEIGKSGLAPHARELVSQAAH